MQTSHAILLSSLFVLSSPTAAAQYKSDAMFGVRAGEQASKMTGVPGMLVSESCGLKETGFVTPSAAAIVQYRFPASQVAIGAGISYSQAKSRVEKTYGRRAESYSLKMHYATLNVGAKVHPVKGAFAKASIGAGPCLNGTTCVKYDGTGMTNAAKMQTAERINQRVRGRMLATAALALGYDFPTGLFVEMSYAQGLTDLLEVGVNDYGFKELRNASRHVGFGIGWLITSDGPSRRRL